MLIAKVVFRVSVLIKISIIIVLFVLFNNVLNNLINKDIKGLNIASVATRNNKDYSVKLFKFVNKVVCFFFLLFLILLIKFKSIKN